MKTLALAVLCLCALAANAHADIIPWMTTTLTDPNSFFSFHLTGKNPNGPQTFDLALTMTVGAFKAVRFSQGFTLEEAPTTLSITGTLTNTKTGATHPFIPEFLGGHAFFESYYAPNPVKQLYAYNYNIYGIWDGSAWFTGTTGALTDTIIPHGQPVTAFVGITTVTPEPGTMLLLGSGLVSAYSVFRLRRSRATASKDAS